MRGAVEQINRAAARMVGQTLTLDPDEEDLKDHVANTFTVVGTVKGPAYVSMEQEHTTAGSGKVGLLAYTADDSFTMDYYTGFYLSVRGAKDMNSFGSAYEDAVAAVTDQLETLGKDRSAIRYEQIVDDANAELDDAKEEYAEKKRPRLTRSLRMPNRNWTTEPRRSQTVKRELKDASPPSITVRQSWILTEPPIIPRLPQPGSS